MQPKPKMSSAKFLLPPCPKSEHILRVFPTPVCEVSKRRLRRWPTPHAEMTNAACGDCNLRTRRFSFPFSRTLFSAFGLISCRVFFCVLGNFKIENSVFYQIQQKIPFFKTHNLKKLRISMQKTLRSVKFLIKTEFEN